MCLAELYFNCKRGKCASSHKFSRILKLLQQSEAKKPGLLSMPNTKHQWVVRQSRQQARLHVLQNRLDFVRELKECMGVHSPKLKELAERDINN